MNFDAAVSATRDDIEANTADGVDGCCVHMNIVRLCATSIGQRDTRIRHQRGAITRRYIPIPAAFPSWGSVAASRSHPRQHSLWSFGTFPTQPERERGGQRLFELGKKPYELICQRSEEW